MEAAFQLRSCAIIAVGSELLTPFRWDTNSLYLTARLNELGIAVRRKTVVGDARDELTVAFHQALESADLVILTGGLGPTDDDLTREVVAEALALPLREDTAILEIIRGRFTQRGLEMPENNRSQALVPATAIPLENINGTAPGLWIDQEKRTVVLLPGPPLELQGVFEQHVLSRLARRASGTTLLRRVLRITGRPESYVEKLAQPVYSRWVNERPPIETTVLATPGQIELHLSTVSQASAAADARLDAAVTALGEVLGADIFSFDGRSLEAVVGTLLKVHGMRIAVAESCTGGLITSRLTDVPGSSAYVDRGVVAYSNEAKAQLLGVPAALIQEHGAVSDVVAQAMADGIAERARVDVGLGVTGVAGSGGGTAEKPVGMVVIAARTRAARRVRAFRFAGTREQIKHQASQAALDMVRRMLEAGR